jgi:hypothetical protein
MKMKRLFALSALAVLGVVSYLVLAATITCTATPCNGTETSDQITDVHSGATTINALGGNDRITVDNGGNIVNGGPGNDIIFGGTGADTLLGQEGNDQIFGGAGNDVGVEGCSDADELGNDRIWADAGNDGTDTKPICGGAGNDEIYGGEGDDVLIGNAGNDRLFGGPGVDRLRGGMGNDILDAGPGKDTLIEGGGGNDMYIFRRGDFAEDETITCTTFPTDRSVVVLVGFTPADLPTGLRPGVITGITPRISDSPTLNPTTGLQITAGPGRCILVLRAR